MAAVYTSVTGVGINSVGRYKQTVKSLSFNSAQTYSTGGFAVSAADMDLYYMAMLEVTGKNSEADKWSINFDPATGKLKFFMVDIAPGAALVELTNGTTITNVVLQLRASGY